MSGFSISFERLPTLHVIATPEILKAVEQSDEEWDWQPLIDVLYDQLETHFMREFVIEDVIED